MKLTVASFLRTDICDRISVSKKKGARKNWFCRTCGAFMMGDKCPAEAILAALAAAKEGTT